MTESKRGFNQTLNDYLKAACSKSIQVIDLFLENCYTVYLTDFLF